jgi:hypothetical protein
MKICIFSRMPWRSSIFYLDIQTLRRLHPWLREVPFGGNQGKFIIWEPFFAARFCLGWTAEIEVGLRGDIENLRLCRFVSFDEYVIFLSVDVYR